MPHGRPTREMHIGASGNAPARASTSSRASPWKKGAAPRGVAGGGRCRESTPNAARTDCGAFGYITARIRECICPMGGMHMSNGCTRAREHPARGACNRQPDMQTPMRAYEYIRIGAGAFGCAQARIREPRSTQRRASVSAHAHGHAAASAASAAAARACIPATRAPTSTSSRPKISNTGATCAAHPLPSAHDQHSAAQAHTHVRSEAIRKQLRRGGATRGH